MPRILVAEFKQETATFNPAMTTYDDFRIVPGSDLINQYNATRTELAGALQVLQAADAEIISGLAVSAVSGGRIGTDDLDRLLSDLLQSFRGHDDIDAVYLCLHGAMAGESEDDPEGRLLAETRALFPNQPLVASLDLHAVLTQRMIDAADVLVPYHTYPHIDHFETGQRAARILLQLLRGEISPTVARIELPMLVRGDELITETGHFGTAIRMCQAIEAEATGLAAGVLIGNAFTDVPALQSNVLITTDDDHDSAVAAAERIGQFMWEHRELFQAELTPISEALEIALLTDGLVVFSDAADATASGAAGDSNAILHALLAEPWPKRSLVPIVDAPAVAGAFDAGVGCQVEVTLGGTRDPGRFTPLPVQATVVSLHTAGFAYEDGRQAHPGQVAVLQCEQVTILVTERPVFVVGQQVFTSHDLQPTDFDLVVVKSPNGFRPWYERFASRIVPVDAPGSTSANLHSLPFQHCVRPIFPLDDAVISPFE